MSGSSWETTWGSGATFSDVNNDGRLDLYVCGYDSPNRLFLNLGDRFVDHTEASGLGFSGASVVMTFCDYDRDGDLDAYLLTNRVHGEIPEFQPIASPQGPQVPEQYREQAYFMNIPMASTWFVQPDNSITCIAMTTVYLSTSVSPRESASCPTLVYRRPGGITIKMVGQIFMWPTISWGLTIFTATTVPMQMVL